jgi:hypothetical protein
MEDMVMAMIMTTDIIAILRATATLTVIHILINIPSILMATAPIITVMEIPLVTETIITAGQGPDRVTGDENRRAGGYL